MVSLSLSTFLEFEMQVAPLKHRRSEGLDRSEAEPEDGQPPREPLIAFGGGALARLP